MKNFSLGLLFYIVFLASAPAETYLLQPYDGIQSGFPIDGDVWEIEVLSQINPKSISEEKVFSLSLRMASENMTYNKIVIKNYNKLSENTRRGGMTQLVGNADITLWKGNSERALSIGANYSDSEVYVTADMPMFSLQFIDASSSQWVTVYYFKIPDKEYIVLVEYNRTVYLGRMYKKSF